MANACSSRGKNDSGIKAAATKERWAVLSRGRYEERPGLGVGAMRRWKVRRMRFGRGGDNAKFVEEIGDVEFYGAFGDVEFAGKFLCWRDFPKANRGLLVRGG